MSGITEVTTAAVLAEGGIAPTNAAVPPLRSLLVAEPGRVVGLVGPAGSGLTRIGLSMLAPASRLGPVAALDVQGWLCPSAAWEVDVPPDRLVIVRCTDPVTWARVAATLVEGLGGVYAEVPAGVKETLLRKLGALARRRRMSLVLRSLQGDLPSGLSHLHLEAAGIVWEGPQTGHGRLRSRRLTVTATGKAVHGMQDTIEMEDDGENPLRVVSRMAATPAGRAAG